MGSLTAAGIESEDSVTQTCGTLTMSAPPMMPYLQRQQSWESGARLTTGRAASRTHAYPRHFDMVFFAQGMSRSKARNLFKQPGGKTSRS
jgi:hypothetical protein